MSISSTLNPTTKLGKSRLRSQPWGVRILPVLAAGLDAMFGRSSAAAAITVFAALSSRTMPRLRMQLRGEWWMQQSILALIEEILGPERIQKATSLSDAAIHTLGSKPGIELLVVMDRLDDRGVHDLVELLVRGIDVHHLDAPGGDVLRERQVKASYGMILAGNCILDSTSATRHLVDLKFNRDETAREVHNELVLADSYASKWRAPIIRRRWGRWLHRALLRVKWDRVINYEKAIKRLQQTHLDSDDIERLLQLQTLVRVVTLLVSAGNSDPVIDVEPRAVKFVMALLDAAGVKDARDMLSPELAKLVTVIKAWVAAPPNDSDGKGFPVPPRYVDGVPFSVYDLINTRNEVRSKAPQTLHSQLKPLKDRGYVETVGKIGKRKLFMLTVRGQNFVQKPLADAIGSWIELSTSTPAKGKTVSQLVGEVLMKK